MVAERRTNILHFRPEREKVQALTAIIEDRKISYPFISCIYKVVDQKTGQVVI